LLAKEDMHPAKKASMSGHEYCYGGCVQLGLGGMQIHWVAYQE
jgi:hypothetical protein